MLLHLYGLISIVTVFFIYLFREANSAEVKKLPVLMTVSIFVKLLLWQVNKTYNLTWSHFPPPPREPKI